MGVALGLGESQVAAYSCHPPFMHVYIWFTRETSGAVEKHERGEAGGARLPSSSVG